MITAETPFTFCTTPNKHAILLLGLYPEPKIWSFPSSNINIKCKHFDRKTKATPIWLTVVRVRPTLQGGFWKEKVFFVWVKVFRPTLLFWFHWKNFFLQKFEKIKQRNKKLRIKLKCNHFSSSYLNLTAVK